MKQPFQYIDVDTACTKFVKWSDEFGEASALFALKVMTGER